MAMTNHSNGQVTRFVINPNAKLSQVLIRIRTGVTNYYVYGPGLLYEVTETATNSYLRYYHYDYRGSTVALTDHESRVTDRYEYSSYGTLTYRSDNTDTPFLFNGRYGVQNDPNGLLYMRARYYNPYICRFINPDPIGFSGGLNWYAFADGNPVNYLDPYGLWVETAWDAANIGMGAYSLQANIRAGNWGWAALDAVGLVYDVTATAVPFLPAGVSAGIKAARAGNTAADSVRAGLDVARVADTTHQAAKALDAASTVPLEAARQGHWLHARVASETADSMRYFDVTCMTGANQWTGKAPDMVGLGVWADITTARGWGKHVNRYTFDFGEGIPILYERGVGVVGTSRLLPFAGVTTFSAQHLTGIDWSYSGTVGLK